jgi:hypothetical protein
MVRREAEPPPGCISRQACPYLVSQVELGDCLTLLDNLTNEFVTASEARRTF